jgi:hypothetical protein
MEVIESEPETKKVSKAPAAPQRVLMSPIKNGLSPVKAVVVPAAI